MIESPNSGSTIPAIIIKKTVLYGRCRTEVCITQHSGYYYSTPVDPGDFVSTVDSTGINFANTNIEAILIKVAIYYSAKLIFCMATFCFYYCLASRLHRIHKAT